MITSELNLGNLKSKDLTGKVDFSNVEVGFIGGLPTFIPTTRRENSDNCNQKIIEELEKIKAERSKGFCDWYDEMKYADTIIEADKENKE